MRGIFLKHLLLCSVLLIFSEATKDLLHFDKLLYNSLAEKLTNEQIKSFFSLQKRWQWLGYIFLPIYILLKTAVIGSIVYIGVFFFSKNEVTFKRIWNCVLKAEFIFLAVPISKLIWFYFFQPNYTLEDIQYFYPLSALNIIGYKGLEPWLIYPLQTINFFELAYIIYLSYCIGQITETNTDNGLKIVASSYVPALLLWIVVIMFFTLNYS